MADERIEADEPSPRRPRPRDDDDFDGPRPKRQRDNDFDEAPRRRRQDDDDVTEDATGGLIPYKNPSALISYYTGILSLLPVFGLVLGPIAIILGIKGLQYRSAHPKARGSAHAIIGIVLGTMATLGNYGCGIIYLLMPHGWGK